MKKGWYWPWLVAALLLFTAGFQGWLLYAATHDPSMSIEPDYYRKAVAWDSRMAQDSVNRSLGWRAVASLGAVGPDGAGLTLVLTDDAGAPVSGARVRVTGIHNLDGARHVRGALAEAGSGAYAARLPFDRAGLWELQVEALRGHDRFTVSLRTDAVAGAP